MPRYDHQFDPPAPCLPIALIHPTYPTRRRAVMAQLDTGADISAIPWAIISALALTYAGDLLVAGYGETATRVPMYRLTLEIAGRILDAMKVVGTPSNYALLGRDVLNRFLTTLDGPHLSFEITASDL